MSDLRTLKIVYLDDEPALAEIFASILAGPAFEIKTFIVPEEAIAYINSQPVDLVFIDQQLQGMSGDWVAAKLNADIPKVLVSGDLSIPTQGNYLRKFEKPFPWDDIQAFLTEFKKGKADS